MHARTVRFGDTFPGQTTLAGSQGLLVMSDSMLAPGGDVVLRGAGEPSAMGTGHNDEIVVSQQLAVLTSQR